MVNAALWVDFWDKGAGREGELGAGEDVEEVVGRVAASVAFGANGGAEDYEVFGYACEDCGKGESVSGRDTWSRAREICFIGGIFKVLGNEL